MITIYVLRAYSFFCIQMEKKKSLSHFQQKPYVKFTLQRLNYNLRKICQQTTGAQEASGNPFTGYEEVVFLP